MRSICLVPVVAASLILGIDVASADTVGCSIAELQKLAPSGTTISAASTVAAAEKLPDYCLVKGSVATPGNTVDFELGLPKNWNGKFYFQGVGGFAGSMGRLNSGLERGYASATTDTGHKGGGTDGSWALNNRPKELDYGHRGTHATTVAAKQLTGAYFGNPPKYAYFNGCSNGGRQALMEAQRYPEDYSGIIAGDPSLGALGYVRRTLTYQFLLASPDRTLTPQKLEVLTKAAVAACDKSDGLEDGLIGDPRMCKFDPTPLKCTKGDGPDCLTAGQVDAVKFVYGDLKTPQGDVMRGSAVGHEAGATGWQAWITGKTAPAPQANGTTAFGEESPSGYRFADGFLRYMAFEKDDANFDWRTFDMKRDLPKITTMAEAISPTADLVKLQQAGAKLLMYHGWADPGITPYGTVDYYNKVVKNVGGKEKADDFVRLFMVPGMHHCAGGPGPNTFDSLTALEQWVEKGKAPEQMIATHATNGKADRTRPLCAEPKVAKYSGKGSVDEAANFTCVVPSKS